MPPLRRRLVRRAIARRAIGRAVARRAIARRALTGGAYRRRAGRRCAGRRRSNGIWTARRSAGFTDLFKKAWGGIQKGLAWYNRNKQNIKQAVDFGKSAIAGAKQVYNQFKGSQTSGLYRRRRKGGRRKGRRTSKGLWGHITNVTG